MEKLLFYGELERLPMQELEALYNRLLDAELNGLSDLVFKASLCNPQKLQNKHQVIGYQTQIAVMLEALREIMQYRAQVTIVLRMRYAEKLNIQIPEVVPNG